MWLKVSWLGGPVLERQQLLEKQLFLLGKLGHVGAPFGPAQARAQRRRRSSPEIQLKREDHNSH